MEKTEKITNLTRCPSCLGYIVGDNDEKCPKCHFNFTKSLKKFTFDPVKISRYCDPDLILTYEDRNKIDEEIEKSHIQFPQINFSFFITRLDSRINPLELGFWLVNSSKIETKIESLNNYYLILTLFDLENRRISITLGYEVMEVLGRKYLNNLFKGANFQSDKEDIPSIIVYIVNKTREELEKEHSKLGKNI